MKKDNNLEAKKEEIIFGDVPRREMKTHWACFPQVNLEGLPPVKEYSCIKVKEQITIDGKLDEKVWAKAEWSEPFGKIDDGSKVEFETRVALLWDKDYLYAGYKVEDPDIRGTISNYNSHEHVYQNDEDVEIFVEGDSSYYEMGINSINQTYQLNWDWIEPLIRKNDFNTLDKWFKSPNNIYFAARTGEPIGRFGDMDFKLEGLKHAVQIDGTINCPEIKDKGWTVELALPWKGLKIIAGEKSFPPNAGDILRIAAYRAHHYRDNRKIPGGLNFEGWTWPIIGNLNIHVPERWIKVKFLEG